ncbi:MULTISPECIES: caspase family protein [Rhodopseudomonas]|uniref:Caspase n=1 Tax=Rhodopseudomonas palustris TaxID=1076 RepID=A0A0D7EHT4_RHOPL|nr:MULTISPECIES: caspase family protein [Rhodopseudomonas]KIZ40318.1 caspase [Rhodopseudomonas palustris]MDF3810514.1 caspase family protein [Rhodopseudomonas sp. BAL398]WOK20229.1 caspase family protein [Rhodopseudomonas sp. BAL398]
MFRSMLCGATLAAGMMFGGDLALAESRVALVIGQSAYRAVTALPNPANDAKAIGQMLGDAGFEVTSASDLSQIELRQQVSDFAAKVAAKGPDTIALMFYAGHGLQIDGENYLVPIDVDPQREADIPLQAVRLNDILNTLTSVPSKTRIILLDACRNNPFPAINGTAGRGLAHVDVKFGTAGTLLAFSTSPGAEAEDGSGDNSPYTTALLKAGREPGLPIEDTFKRVRLAVNQATDGRQTPWESSSLVNDFSFFGAGESDPKPVSDKAADDQQRADNEPGAKRTVEQWRAALKGKSAQQANELVVYDGSAPAYEAFVELYSDKPFAPQAREWLERRARMIAWNNAVLANTGAAYRAFLDAYPDSDLTATARKLEERTRNRPNTIAVLAAPNAAASTAALTCPCGPPPTPPVLQKKVDLPKARPQVERADRPKRRVTKPQVERDDRSKPRATRPRGRAQPDDDYYDDDVVVRRPPRIYPGPIIGGGPIIRFPRGGYRGSYDGGGRGGGRGQSIGRY